METAGKKEVYDELIRALDNAQKQRGRPIDDETNYWAFRLRMVAPKRVQDAHAKLIASQNSTADTQAAGDDLIEAMKSDLGFR